MIYDGKEMRNFFTDTVEQAITRQQLDLSRTARKYLVDMLERFADPVKQPTSNDEPITFQYSRILRETYRLRQEQLQQQLGDHCLFLVGYFYDALRKKGEGQIEYHSQIGAAAYQDAGIYPFAELAQKFNDLYIVVGNLHLPELDRQEKLADVYQKWLETGDRYYESLLLGKGVVPQRGIDKNN